MNESDDRQTPPDSSGPPSSPGPWLPPRLRERLEAASMPEPKPSKAGPIIMVLTLVLVGGGVGWLIWSNQMKAKAAKAAAAAAAAAAAKAEADSLARVRVADSLAVIARADSIAAFMKLPAWEQRRLMGVATGKPVVEEKGPFFIDAGSFLFEDAANAALAAIKGKTKYDVSLVTVEEDGNPTYHIRLGKFDHREEAQDIGDLLLGKGVLNQAKVVK